MGEKPEPRRVLGEDLPWPVPLALVGLGLVFGALALWGYARGTESRTAESGSEPPPLTTTPSAELISSRTSPPSESVVTEHSRAQVVNAESQTEVGADASSSSATEPPLRCSDPLIVPFDYASHELSESARREVRRFARWAAERPGRVVVRGHTDRAGSTSHNLALARRRALAVAAVLRARGVSEERLLIQALGEYQPVGRSAARNRRVEAFLEVDGCTAGGGT